MTTSFTYAQQDSNWLELDSETRNYFHKLAAGDSSRNGQEFFQDTVPVELQDNPGHVNVFLNGGTVEVPVDVHSQGRAGTTSETVEFEVSDKDWSHDVSVKNGGSGSADNGRFEDASVNRSRQERNTTASEQEAAEAASEQDTETLLQSLEDVTEAGGVGLGVEVASGLLEATLDGLIPLTATVVAGKKAYDHFDSPTDKVGFGALASGAAWLYFASPLGAPTVGAYLLYKAGEKGVNLYKKHVAA